GTAHDDAVVLFNFVEQLVTAQIVITRYVNIPLLKYFFSEGMNVIKNEYIKRHKVRFTVCLLSKFSDQTFDFFDTDIILNGTDNHRNFDIHIVQDRSEEHTSELQSRFDLV